MTERDEYNEDREVEDAEPAIQEGEECEIDGAPATIAHDGLFYCEDCYATDILHQ